MNLFNNVLVHIEGSKIALNIGISHAKVFMESHFGMKHFYVIHIIRTTMGIYVCSLNLHETFNNIISAQFKQDSSFSIANEMYK